MAARARQIGAQSWLCLTKFRRISAFSANKVQSGSSFYSTSSSNRYKFDANRVLERIEMTQEANPSKLKSELQSFQDRSFTLLRNEIEKLRLGMNKGAEELRVEKSNGMKQIRVEIRGIIADLEAAKKELRNYLIAIVIAFAAAVTGMRLRLSKNN